MASHLVPSTRAPARTNSAHASVHTKRSTSDTHGPPTTNMASGCPRQPRPPLQLRLLFLGVYAPGAHGTEAGAEWEQGVSHGMRILDSAWSPRCGLWLGAPPDPLDCVGGDGMPKRQRHAAPSARQRRFQSIFDRLGHLQTDHVSQLGHPLRLRELRLWKEPVVQFFLLRSDSK